MARTVNGIATYWKNGTVITLDDPSLPPSNYRRSAARSIFVSGNDVYVAGGINKGDFGVAAYWKNGAITYLSNDTSLYHPFTYRGMIYMPLARLSLMGTLPQLAGKTAYQHITAIRQGTLRL